HYSRKGVWESWLRDSELAKKQSSRRQKVNHQIREQSSSVQPSLTSQNKKVRRRRLIKGQIHH
ncbi:MAG: hypothetical protein D6814_15980, partial [Calditrichaeota bacterium]